ncbi:MAG: hypothetical protein VW450_00655 [Chloroflexota bacterium]
MATHHAHGWSGIPLFMDRYFVAGSIWRTLETAREKYMAPQDEYGVKSVTYWFDEDRHTAFCQAEADFKSGAGGTARARPR